LSIVDAILAMGRSLDMKVIAEGVETDQQLQILRRQHCDTTDRLVPAPPTAISAPGRPSPSNPSSILSSMVSVVAPNSAGESKQMVLRANTAITLALPSSTSLRAWPTSAEVNTSTCVFDTLSQQAGRPELRRNSWSMHLAKDVAICVMASRSANSPIAAFIGLPEAARKLRRSPDASGTAPAGSR
jgi:hypothetical protein